MDVLDISAVTRIADGAEALLKHELGEAENRVERRAHLVADLGEKIEAPCDGGRIEVLLCLLGLGNGLGLRIGRRLGVEHRAIDEAEKLKLARERFHVEADLETPAAAGQCLNSDPPLRPLCVSALSRDTPPGTMASRPPAAASSSKDR